MAAINSNFLKLKAGYLFPEIARRVKAYGEAHPELAARIIRCGIGDVTEPLPPAVVKAMHEGVDEMASRESFKGYGPEQGYEFLRQAIVDSQFANLGISAEEVFISDGSKMRHGQHPRHLWPRQHHRHHRSGLPSLCRHQCDGWQHRRCG